MKRYLLRLGCVCLALLITAPAWAMDVDFSGYYRARGFYHDNTALTSTHTSASYMDMKFRLNTVFKVSDDIRITTQFDALDRMWGEDTATNEVTTRKGDNIDFNVAYATIRTPVGGLLVGRQWNTVWGLNIGDSSGPVDRILYFLPIDKWSFAAYAQWYTEGQASNDLRNQSDADNMKYVALAKYEDKNIEGGLLVAYYDFKSIPSMAQLFDYETYVGGVASGAMPVGTTTTMQYLQAQVWIPDPYIVAKFGPVTLRGEAIYAFGKSKSDAYSYGLYGGAIPIGSAAKDMDVDALSYLANLDFTHGPFSIGGGYWYMQGDNNTKDDKFHAFGYLEQNENLDIGFILTGSSDVTNGDDMQNTLGNSIGNYAGNPFYGSSTGNSGALAMAGAKVWYLTAKYNILDNLSVKVAYLNAKADQPPGPNTGNVVFAQLSGRSATEWSDDVGQEYDVIAKWMPLKQLEYKVVYAYLKAGDFFKQGVATNSVADTYTVFNALTVNF